MAAQPKPGLQSADHEALYGVWTGWNDPQVVNCSVAVAKEVDEYEVLRVEARARLEKSKSSSSNEGSSLQKKARK